jgi:hypothetical protein
MYNFNQASEIIKDSYFTHESITTEQIQKEIVNYLDELVEEINNDPLYFFRENHQFWRKLDKVALAEEEKQQQQQNRVA